MFPPSKVQALLAVVALARNMAVGLGVVRLQPPPLRGLLVGLPFLAVAVVGMAVPIAQLQLTSMRARAGGLVFTPLAVAAQRGLRRLLPQQAA